MLRATRRAPTFATRRRPRRGRADPRRVDPRTGRLASVATCEPRTRRREARPRGTRARSARRALRRSGKLLADDPRIEESISIASFRRCRRIPALLSCRRRRRRESLFPAKDAPLLFVGCTWNATSRRQESFAPRGDRIPILRKANGPAVGTENTLLAVPPILRRASEIGAQAMRTDEGYRWCATYRRNASLTKEPRFGTQNPKSSSRWTGSRSLLDCDALFRPTRWQAQGKDPEGWPRCRTSGPDFSVCPDILRLLAYDQALRIHPPKEARTFMTDQVAIHPMIADESPCNGELVDLVQGREPLASSRISTLHVWSSSIQGGCKRN